MEAEATNGSLDLLTASLLGGLLAGGLTLLGVIVAHTLVVKRQRQQEKEIIRGFLQAVLDEIDTVWQRYMDTMGATVETLSDGQALERYYPLQSDYFTVYHTNSFLLSRVEDEDLRKLIVSTYTNAKGLLDSFRFNNLALEKLENANWTYEQFGLDFFKKRAGVERAILAEYAKFLRNGHYQLKDQVQSLLRALRKQLK